MSSDKRFTETFKYGRVMLRKYKSNGIWQARFYVANLHKYNEKSTGTTSKKDAQEYVDKFLTPKLNNQTFGIADGTIPLTELFDKFVESKSKVYRDKGVRRMRSTMKMFLEWLTTEKKNILKSCDVTPNIIDDYMLYRSQQICELTKRKLSKRTIDVDVQNISTVFRWGIKRKLVASNPADCSKDGPIDLFKAPELEKPVYTKEEYNLLLEEANSEGNALIYDIIVLLANTGMRYGELASLTNKSLNWNTEKVPSITIRTTENFIPKHSSEIKTIPMLPSVETVLRRRSNGVTGHIFLNSIGNLINPNNTRKSFYRLMRQVGIDRKKRPLNWHSWRRYFIKNAVENGVPINILMKWVGHDTVTMVLHYSSTIEYRDSVRAMQKLK